MNGLSQLALCRVCSSFTVQLLTSLRKAHPVLIPRAVGCFSTVLVLLLLGSFPSGAGIPEPDLVWYGRVMVVSGDTVVRATAGTLTWRVEPLSGGAPLVFSTTLTNIHDQFSYLLRVPCETPEPLVANTPNTILLNSPPTGYRRVSVTLDGQPVALSSGAATFTPLPSDRGRTERLDLVLGVLPSDTDGDGMADNWETQHFGGLLAQPNEDPDQDGMSNLKEYRAGTDPRNPQSRFEFIQIAPLPEGMYLRWASQPNRRYVLKRSATLNVGSIGYQTIQSGLAATPPFNEFIDGSAGAGANHFYLLEIEE